MKNETPEVPWAGSLYSVKRHGVSISNCDSEPVQTPGCIQSHGALLSLRLSDLAIQQVSENTATTLGHRPESLLERSVSVVIGEEREQALARFLNTESVEKSPLYVFSLPAEGNRPELDCCVHTVDGVALLEFESTGRSQRVEGKDYYAAVRRCLLRLQAATSLAEFCGLLTQQIRDLTGFDRVMVYKFHADHHGEVIAENKREDLAPWLGLHYPAEDIPAPAREVFRQVWIRPVPEVGAPLAEIVPLGRPDNGRALTLTYCALRGPSVMYTEYLQNMRVTAGLTLSIRRGSELWGLVACHHYQGARHVPAQLRASCELVAQMASLNLETIEQREELEYRLRIEAVHNDLVTQAAQEGGLAAMTDGKPALLDGLAAGGAALFHRERWWTAGKVPRPDQIAALGRWLTQRAEFDSATHPVFCTDELGRVYPPGAEFAEVGSGILAFPLSRARNNMVIWFRPETIQTVNWGGNPDDKPMVVGPQGPRLTPRASFELFTQAVRGKSLPWRSVEINAAARLRVLLMELVVSRVEHVMQLNLDLSRSNEELDAFAYVASHDLREPLRGIHKYAHQLIEDSTTRSDEERSKLERLVRLTVRMDSLIESLLQFSRVGRTALVFEENDVQELVQEALEMVHARAESGVEVVIPRRLPRVRCDRARCREIFVNLVSNALKYNVSATKRIEIGYVAPHEFASLTHSVTAPHASTAFYVRDNGIGIDPRQFQSIFVIFKRLHGRDEYGGGAGAGLGIVKKLVERHNGEVWLESSPGQGSTFYFTLANEGGTPRDGAP